MIPQQNPFILRGPQDERTRIKIIRDFPFMLSTVEAFLGSEPVLNQRHYIITISHQEARNRVVWVAGPV